MLLFHIRTCRYIPEHTQMQAQQSQRDIFPPSQNLWMLQTCQNQCIEEREIRSRRIRLKYILVVLRLASGDSGLIQARASAIFLGHGEHWHLSLRALFYLAVVGSIHVTTWASCHRPQSAVGTYRRRGGGGGRLVVIRAFDCFESSTTSTSK